MSIGINLLEKDDLSQVELLLGRTGYPAWIWLEERLLAIEAQCAGLGETLLAELESAFSQVFFTPTPSAALGMAEMVYWWGESDENSVVNEYVSGGMSEEEARNEVVTKAELMGGLPAWVCKPTRALRRAQLVEIARKRPELANVIYVIKTLSVVQKMSTKIFKSQGDHRYFFGCYPALVRWNKNDCVLRVIDDHCQHEFEGGEGDQAYAAVTINLDTPDSLKSALAEIATGLNLMGRIEHCIRALNIPVEENK
jgi:PRTRC genetic system protein F